MVSALNRVTQHLQHKGQLIPLILLSIAANLAFLSYIDSIRNLIDAVIAFSAAAALRWAGIAGAVLAANILLRGALAIFRHKLYCRCVAELRKRYFVKLNSVSFPQLESYSTADLVTRFTSDLDGIAQFLAGELVDGISNLVFFGMFAVYAVQCDWRLLLIIAPLLPLVFHFVLKRGKLLEQETSAYLDALSQMNTTAKDVFDHTLDIRAFRAEKFFFSKWNSCKTQLVAHEVQKTYHSTALWASGIALYNTIYLFFYSIGGFLTLKGEISFGVVVGLFLITDRLVTILKGFPKLMVSLHEAAAKADRINDILALPEEHQLSCSQQHQMKDCSQAVLIDNLTYGYSQDRPVLLQLSLQVKRGERVAVVGESGCGKSTLLKLMAGYDFSYQGSVQILGRELKNWNPSTLRTHVAYLPQQPFLFSQSVSENLWIYTGCREAKALKRYLQLMELDEKLLSVVLRQGGKNISGGQRQRLGLMIGLLKQSEILLIDEGFFAVDPHMSARILGALLQEYTGTLIAVTHRLADSIMTQFDRIVFLDRGRTVLSGSHQELLHHEPYRALYCKSKQAG